MSWRTLYFGNESPSPQRKLLVNGFYAAFALCIYGAWGDFVPTRELSWAAFVVSILSTLASMAMLLAVFADAARRIRQSAWKSALGLLTAPFLFFAMFWLAFAQGLPNLATWAIGTPATISATLRSDYTPSSRSCDFRLYGAALDRKFPNYVCIAEPMHRSLPKEAKVTLEGRSSALGFRIERVRAP